MYSIFYHLILYTLASSCLAKDGTKPQRMAHTSRSLAYGTPGRTQLSFESVPRLPSTERTTGT